MKKILYIYTVIMILAVATVECYAEGIWDRIKDHSVKVALAYDTSNHKSEGAIGGAINKDFFGYKGIDLDGFITGEASKAFADDDKNILTGLSYNYYFGKDKSWSAYLGGGFIGNDILDIQKIRDESNLEIDQAVYFGFGKKFN